MGLPKDQVSLDPGEFYGLFGVYSLFMVYIYIWTMEIVLLVTGVDKPNIAGGTTL